MSANNDPDLTDPKRLINASLLAIKNEIANSQTDDFCDYDEDESFDEASSQPFRQQQFYQDLDNTLDGLSKELYVKELLKSCNSDFFKITDYRKRLAERARQLPLCPQGRLVNRKSSSRASREEKCASDCYILNCFINGRQTRDISDVFSSPSVTFNDTIAIGDPINSDDIFMKPDSLAILSKIQSDVAEISRKQASDSLTLQNLQADIQCINVTFRTFHAALNSILARLPTQNSTMQIAKLQNDVSKLGSTFATLNQRVVDVTPSRPSNLTRSFVEAVKSPEKLLSTTVEADKGAAAATEVTVPITTESRSDKKETLIMKDSQDSQTACKSTESRSSTTLLKGGVDSASAKCFNYKSGSQVDDNKSKENKLFEKNCSSKMEDTNSTKGTFNNSISEPSNRFIAARRRRITSYYVGNIHPDVNETDIHDYLRENAIKATHIKMFHGRYGSSAKVNIHHEDEIKIEREGFWPEDITCRKWKNRSEQEALRRKDRESRRIPERNFYANEDDDSFFDDNNRSTKLKSAKQLWKHSSHKYSERYDNDRYHVNKRRGNDLYSAEDRYRNTDRYEHRNVYDNERYHDYDRYHDEEQYHDDDRYQNDREDNWESNHDDWYDRKGDDK